MPLNSISNLMKYNLSSLGGMAYQQSSNVQISGGGIYSNSPLNITLTNGKILVQGENADLTIAGPAGKTQLRSNDIDKYLTVYDPYTNKGGRFHFGAPKNANAAQLYAGGGTDDANSFTLSSGAEMNSTFHDAEAGSRKQEALEISSILVFPEPQACSRSRSLVASMTGPLDFSELLAGYPKLIALGLQVSQMEQ